MLEQFRAFLRSLMMHAGVGTALGGVMTMVGEPQNLIIAKAAEWHFGEFFLRMAPVSVPVLVCGLATCVLVEKFNLFGYGATLPDQVRQSCISLTSRAANNARARDAAPDCTGFHRRVAYRCAGLPPCRGGADWPVGNYPCNQPGRRYGRTCYWKSLYRSAAVYRSAGGVFAVVAVIIDQHLFAPIIAFVLQATPDSQLTLFYLFNGLLSSISDNVFVGTVYINEAKAAMEQGIVSSEQFELLAVAINTGTNLPSVATPNGQAAFLFLLTSALAPLIRLSYGRMVWMALPYTLVLTPVGLLCIKITLVPCTQWLLQAGILAAH